MSDFFNPSGQSPTAGLLPYFFTFALILLSHVPVSMPWLSGITAGFFLVPIYFVATRGDDYFAGLVLLLMGIVNDLISETPIGFWGLIFCLYFLLVRSQFWVVARGDFRVRWSVFAGTCLAAYFLAFIMAAWRDDMNVDALASFLSALVTIIGFPVIWLLLDYFVQDIKADI